MKLLATFFLLMIMIHADETILLEPIDIIADTQIIDTKDAIHIDKTSLEVAQVRDIEDLSVFIPSLSISNYGSRNVAFDSYRGHTNFMTTSSPVGLYVDDIPLTYSSTFLAQELFNTSGVTMLKGPQGFDNGLGAQAGIIKLHSDERIVSEVQGSVEAGLANYGEYKASAHISAPIADGMLKIDALYKERDGFTTNLYDDSSLDDIQTKAVSAKFIKAFDGGYRVTLQAMLNSNDDGGTPYQSTPDVPFEMDQNINGYVRQDNLMGAVKLEYFGDDFDLRSVTTLSDYDSTELLDADRTPADFVELRSKDRLKEISQEFVADYGDEEQSLIGGLFLSHQFTRTYEERHDFNYLDVAGYRLWQTSQPEQNAALFTTYKKVFERKWQMELGLRYNVVRKSFDNRFSDDFPIEVPDYGLINTPISTVDETKQWQRLLPKLSLTYLTDTDAQAYLTYSQGFKSGGYSYDDYNTSTASYEPEDSDTLELGYVSGLSGGFSYSASLYATRVKELQVETVHADLSSSIDNSAKAEIYGLEARMHYRLNDDLDFQSAMAVTRAKYREYLSNGIDYSGNHILNVPSYTLFLGAQYAITKAFYTSASLRAQGKTYFDKANSISQSDYLLADMLVGYESGPVSLDIYVKNLFDKRYFDNITSIGEESAYNFGEPRRIGMSLRYAFR